MAIDFFNNINPLSYLVWITFVISCFFYLKKTKKIVWVVVICLINFLTDISTLMCIYSNKSFTTIYNINFMLHHFFWIYILFTFNRKFSFLHYVLVAFVVFALTNLFFIEKQSLNYYTFVVGALFYIVSFIVLSFYHLKNENLNYFTTNQYLLQTTPVVFFIGLTFIYAFRDSDMRNIIVYNNIDLYTFIAVIVNIIYYTLLNVYFFKERKQHA